MVSPTRLSTPRGKSTDAAGDTPARDGLPRRARRDRGLRPVGGQPGDRAGLGLLRRTRLQGGRPPASWTGRWPTARWPWWPNASPPCRWPADAFILVDDVRHALARAAAAFYPRQPDTIVAVTGTSGKTSVAAFCRQIWATLGLPAASLGHAWRRRAGRRVYGSLTTPDTVALHGPSTTSPAQASPTSRWKPRRTASSRSASTASASPPAPSPTCRATTSTITARSRPISQAKLRLFETLLPPGCPAVVDADGEAAPAVVAACARRGLDVVTVGRAGRSLRLIEARPDDLAVALTLEVTGGGCRRSCRSPATSRCRTRSSRRGCASLRAARPRRCWPRSPRWRARRAAAARRSARSGAGLRRLRPQARRARKSAGHPAAAGAGAAGRGVRLRRRP